MNKFRVVAIAGGIILILTAVVICLSSVSLYVRRPAFKFDQRVHRPESVEETRAFLTRVASRIDQLDPNANRSDAMDMMKLSAALYQRTIEHPELPEVWKTAALVIDKRSTNNSDQVALGCGENPNTVSQAESPDRFERVALMAYHDCVISLDDGMRVIARDRRTAVENPTINLLELKNVHVTYRGGSFPLVTTFSCVQCTFDMQVLSIPSPRGKSFLRGLLMAYSENFAIEISDDDPDEFMAR